MSDIQTVTAMRFSYLLFKHTTHFIIIIHNPSHSLSHDANVDGSDDFSSLCWCELSSYLSRSNGFFRMNAIKKMKKMRDKKEEKVSAIYQITPETSREVQNQFLLSARINENWHRHQKGQSRLRKWNRVKNETLIFHQIH